MSESTVASDILLQGCWFALEQAGLLLADSVLLRDAGANSTAAGLALLAREEMGRYGILRDLWAATAAGRTAPTPAQVRALCENHVKKQRRAFFSSVHRAEGDSSWAVLLRSFLRLPYQSAEAEAIRDKVEAGRRAKDKRTPDERHINRMRAFYVDLHENGKEWRRPADLAPAETRDWLYDAVNDYSIQRDRLTTPGVREVAVPELAKALDGWPTKPPLPPPRWPRCPEDRQQAKQ